MMTMPFPERLPVGSLLDDYYEITGYLGSGGFADVYSGTQRDTGMDIAIKVMKPLSAAPSAKRTFERRFIQEAQVAARINHPNVVTILACRSNMLLTLPDGQQDQFDRLYIAMELLQGLDLQQGLLEGGAMAPERALPLVLSCLDGLARGHELGIVHKDLKPSNLFLTEPGSRVEILKILDYGIARAGATPNEKLTHAGEAVFTPQYAAPEYIEDLTATPALDVYQMGLVLIEMLTGHAVVQAETALTCMILHAKGLSVPPELMGTPLGPVLEKAIHKDHTQRYQNAAAFAEALEGLDKRRTRGLKAKPQPQSNQNQEDKVLPHSVASAQPHGPSAPVPVATRAEAPHHERTPTLQESGYPAPPPPPEFPIAPESGGGRSPAKGIAIALGLGAVGMLGIGALVAIGVIVTMASDSDEDIIAAAVNRCESAGECYSLAKDHTKGRGVDKHLGAAAALYEKACQKGSAKGCEALAVVCEKGRGVEKSSSKAFHWNKKACEEGKKSLCNDLALKYERGKGFKKSYDKAARLYKLACDKGSPDACQALGSMHAKGRGVTRNREKAVELYMRACKQDETDDCFLLFKKGCKDGRTEDCGEFARMYLLGEGVERNPNRAFELHRLACEKANGEECYEFALNYDKGRGGVVLDDAKAAQLYQIACDKKDSRACTNLGFAYERGLGLAKDPKVASKLYKKACKMSYGLGCNNVGVVYREGIGVGQNFEKASEYFDKSCDLGYKAGCTNLGFLYDKGNGVKQSDSKAIKLYREGCDGGNLLGCSNLGVMYEKGRGVAKDVAKARSLYKKACDGGNSNGCKNLDILNRNGRTKTL